MSRTAPTTIVPPRDYVFDAIVLDVHDADTVKCAVLLRRVAYDMPLGDLAFHDHIEDVHKPSWTRPQRWLVRHLSFRLHGINAPELGTEAGKNARAYLKGLIDNGTWIKAQSHRPTKDFDPDKYGDRWLGVLFKNGLNVNQELIRTGHAKAWDGRGTKPV